MRLLVWFCLCCVSASKKDEIDESMLPDMRTFVESVGLTQFLPLLEAKGYERTRQFLRWGKSDVQLLGAELSLSREACDTIHERIVELKKGAKKSCQNPEFEDEDARLRRERDALTYGRLTASRATSFFDYKKAWFGSSLPYGYVSLVRADPVDACGPARADYAGRAVLADRGGCSFLEKARNVLNASVLVVVNTQGLPLDRPASGYAALQARDNNNESAPSSASSSSSSSSSSTAQVDVAVVLVEASGIALEKADDIRFVPLKCVAGNAQCQPLLRDDESAAAADSGFVNEQFEFVSAAWGAILPRGPRPLVVSPLDNNLCTRINWLRRALRRSVRSFAAEAKDAVVLARRGGCSFGVKAENAAHLGSVALIVSQTSEQDALVRMGVASGAAAPAIPAVMVETHAGEALAEAGGNVTFEPDHFAARWLELEETANLDKAQLSELEHKNRDSAARLAWLRRHSN